ncbi:Clp protease N-terminal domain-containing protein [Kineococcus sp. SYSU DK002]|uniref:Clp protease N-terminal domain-containing protein n=1 Tax=Kineococcus sp. SYSU DK002 TaxID=3383123 RepID=UPI003D7E74B7
MWRQSRYVTSAALEEAAQLGHPELDQEHLLLGLLVTGGPSAALLTAAGVDLPGLRRAVTEVQQRDLAHLAHLGLQVPPTAAPDGPEPSFRAAQAIPFNDRAMAVMKRIPYEGDDRELLLALVDDEGRRVERVLTHLGVDVDALRAATGTGATAPGTGAGRVRGAGSVVRHAQDVPVDAARVWDLVSDVRRRPEWDAACVGVATSPDGVERLTYRGRRREVVAEQVVSHLVPGEEIAWRRYRVGNRETAVTSRVRVEPVGATCRVHLETGSDRRTLLGRVLRPLVVRLAGSQLRWHAQAIARAAAR